MTSLVVLMIFMSVLVRGLERKTELIGDRYIHRLMMRYIHTLTDYEELALVTVEAEKPHNLQVGDSGESVL